MFRLGIAAPTECWTGTLEYYEVVQTQSPTPQPSSSPPAITATSAEPTGTSVAPPNDICVGSQVQRLYSYIPVTGIVERIEGSSCWVKWDGSSELMENKLEQLKLYASSGSAATTTTTGNVPALSLNVAAATPAETTNAPTTPIGSTVPSVATKLLERKKVVLEPAKLGQRVILGVVLWLDVGRSGKVTGCMELCEFRARIRVEGQWIPQDSLLILEEKCLLAGKNSEWHCRFGQDQYRPGTRYELKVNANNDEMTSEFRVPTNPSNQETRAASPTAAAGALKVQRKRLFYLSSDAHGSSMIVPKERTSVRLSPLGNESSLAGLALSEVGFSQGVHYWEIKVDSADDHGTVFCGVVERQPNPIYPAGVPVPNLNKWEKVPVSWGFISFRATLWMTASSSTGGTEQIYGEFFETGDTVGVLLDLDVGEISFFIDALKFGEHIMRDLGPAFLPHQLGSRLPIKWSSTNEIQMLYPAIGLKRCAGDAVSVTSKYISFPSSNPQDELDNMARISSLLRGHFKSALDETDELVQHAGAVNNNSWKRFAIPSWFVKQSYAHYVRWSENRYRTVQSRAGGRTVELDISPEAMAAASIAGGVTEPFFVGERVKTIQSQGRELSAPENALILGARMNRIWYSIITVSTHEGFGDGATWAFYWDPEELPLLMRGDDDHSVSPLSPKPSQSSSPFPTEKTSTVLSFDEFVSQVCGDDWTNEMDYELVRLVNFVLQREGEQDAINLNFNRDYSIPSFANQMKKSEHACKGRIAILRLFNCMIKRCLPFLSPPPATSTLGTTVSLSTIESENAYNNPGAERNVAAGFANWCYRSRRFIFTSTKKCFWEAVLKSTTTGTTLSSEEYVDPPQIRTVCVNRIKATPAKLALINSDSKRLKRSVFGQLYAEMVKWPDHSFRRAYCGKGHGGQKRAFKLKLIGEGVDDYGGPYRQAFEVVCDELQNDSEWPDSRRACLLPLLIPCPNRYSGVGDIGRDKFILNPSARSPSLLRRFEFLGKLMGTAVRHGLQLGLDFPSLFWRRLVGQPVYRKHLEEVDVALVRDLKSLENATQENFQDLTGGDRKFQVVLSDGTVVGDESIPITLENVQEYIKYALNVRLKESDLQLAALKKGLAAVLPLEHFSLFTAEELETLVCGRRELDVELLKSVTEYEGVQESDSHVKWFWEVLEEMNAEDRTAFLKFVWARSRMPSKAEMSTAFHLQQPSGGAAEKPDDYLPSAQTCFFSLALPRYSSKELLRTKFLKAIECTLMDADVRLRSAEGWAEV